MTLRADAPCTQRLREQGEPAHNAVSEARGIENVETQISKAPKYARIQIGAGSCQTILLRTMARPAARIRLPVLGHEIGIGGANRLGG